MPGSAGKTSGSGGLSAGLCLTILPREGERLRSGEAWNMACVVLIRAGAAGHAAALWAGRRRGRNQRPEGARGGGSGGRTAKAVSESCAGYFARLQRGPQRYRPAAHGMGWLGHAEQGSLPASWQRGKGRSRRHAAARFLPARQCEPCGIGHAARREWRGGGAGGGRSERPESAAEQGAGMRRRDGSHMRCLGGRGARDQGVPV